jgi:hypothetical protein
VKGLHKAFGGLVAVNGLWFHVERGEIVGLLGPNICVASETHAARAAILGALLLRRPPTTTCARGTPARSPCTFCWASPT